MNKCKNCAWGTYKEPNKVFCMFPSCFKEVKKDAKEWVPHLVEDFAKFHRGV